MSLVVVSVAEVVDIAFAEASIVVAEVVDVAFSEASTDTPVYSSANVSADIVAAVVIIRLLEATAYFLASAVFENIEPVVDFNSNILFRNGLP